MHVLRIGGGAIAGLAVLAIATSVLTTRRLKQQFERDKVTLLSHGVGGVGGVDRVAGDDRVSGAPDVPLQIDAAAVAALPAPVRRYLETTGATDRAPLRVAVLKQRGMLFSAPDAPGMPFSAEQVYAARPAAFVWFARATMAKVLPLYVRDRYVEGTGEMLVKLLGTIAVVDESGPTMDQGAALRFWGEMLAFPEFVRDPRLAWTAVDDRQARLVVHDPPLRLEALVEFAEDGRLYAVHAERFRDVQGTGVLTPWSGYMRDWRRIGDREFPATWESVWHLESGDLLAVTMTITDVHVESYSAVP